MRLKIKKRPHTIGKQRAAATIYRERFPDYSTGKKHTFSKELVGALQTNKISINNILKYNFKKILNKHDTYLHNKMQYSRYKNTKGVQQLLAIKYIGNLIKRIYYVVKVMCKIVKYLNIWVNQHVQTELYYYKKALQVATRKEEKIYAYIKYNKIKQIYKKVHLFYVRELCRMYYSTLKKYKKQWKHDILIQTAVRAKKRNTIIPLIFSIRKRLFRHIRLGTMYNIKYWINNIKKITKKYYILRYASTSILYKRLDQESNIVRKELSAYQNNALWPLILLMNICLLNKRYKAGIINNIKTKYYNIISKYIAAQQCSKSSQKQKKIRLIHNKKKIKKKYKKRNRKYHILMIMNHLIHGKQKYIINDTYLRNRVSVAAGRIKQYASIVENNNNKKLKIMLQLLTKKYVSVMLMLYQYWTKLPLFKYLAAYKRWRHYRKLKRNIIIPSRFENRRTRKSNKRYMYKMKGTCKWRFIRRISTHRYRSNKIFKNYMHTLQRDYMAYWINDYARFNKFQNKKRRRFNFDRVQTVKNHRYRWHKKKSKLYHMTPANITFIKQVNLYQTLKQLFVI